jgi:signal transduction histidine kinase
MRKRMTNQDKEPANIMIVDDEPANLSVLECLLHQEGYRVRAFPQGELALAAASQEPPALVLLDIRMPEMDGYEVCRRFKADPDLRDIPILFISALSAASDIAAGFECGGVDYLGKPFRKSEVLARVNSHLALREAYVKLAAEHAQLRLLERHRDLLTHMLVHDMRGPLQVIGGHLEMIRDSDAGGNHLPADDRLNLSAASGGVRVLSQMVSTVVDISRMEAASMPLNPVPAVPAEVFAAACGQAIEPANLYRLTSGVSPDCPPLWCDFELTVRIVANLLTNALKYAPDPSRITIGAESAPQGARLWVRDQGPGIPVPEQQRIFEKFGVGSQPTGKPFASTGLGLAFCKLAVEAQGGAIGVDSLPGAGSTFWFTLPAALA